MKKTLGGDRLGAGKRMKVETQNYQRSTHNMSYKWRSTMSAGTLVPFMKQVALPGDTWEIHLDLDGKTHPTVGPLFGEIKWECDIFQVPFRFYNGQLHNNKLNIGLNMSAVKFPIMKLFVDPALTVPDSDVGDADNAQVNPSSLLAYLGVRGVGIVDPTEPGLVERDLNAMGVLAYYDIVKNYYANKQEPTFYIIHKTPAALVATIDDITLGGALVPERPAADEFIAVTGSGITLEIDYTGAVPILAQIVFNTSIGQLPGSVALTMRVDAAGEINGVWNFARTGPVVVYSWGMINAGDLLLDSPTLQAVDLADVDGMREYILTHTQNSAPFDIVADAGGIPPYSLILNWVQGLSPYKTGQEGLAVKTYMSDLYNNWLNEDWIDGVNGINEITRIDTTGNSFTVESLILAKKVYNMLNDIAVSGGTYDDYLDVVYDEERFTRAETPIYEGGMIKEMMFQEVISNSEATSTNLQGDAAGNQPLGTLAGKGVMARDKKGGNITIKVQEPGYIMGIVSGTPRIDYSQGNDWDIHLQSIDDLHKPALDGIGFQDLIQENMAWWTTEKTIALAPWNQKSAGKQPAWINYMTNVNKVYGNFAIADNEMFMVINRRYEKTGASGIADLTTYIDPVKFNYSFAQTSIDAQNFWIQIAVDLEVRRKMSAKIMPNL